MRRLGKPVTGRAATARERGVQVGRTFDKTSFNRSATSYRKVGIESVEGVLGCAYRVTLTGARYNQPWRDGSAFIGRSPGCASAPLVEPVRARNARSSTVLATGDVRFSGGNGTGLPQPKGAGGPWQGREGPVGGCDARYTQTPRHTNRTQMKPARLKTVLT
jgi:hypothetical protein